MCFKKHFSSRVSCALLCSIARSPQHPSPASPSHSEGPPPPLHPQPPHHLLPLFFFFFISLLLYTPLTLHFPALAISSFFPLFFPPSDSGVLQVQSFFFLNTQKMIRLGFEHQTKRLKGFGFSTFGKSWCTNVYKAWSFNKQLNIRHPQRKSCPLPLMSRAHFISKAEVLVWAQRIFWFHWNL